MFSQSAGPEKRGAGPDFSLEKDLSQATWVDDRVNKSL